ncbi:hypothetical protein Tco_0907931 [Tanacetum coccineum]|uniref:Uncharacterized protein n=1 Tax=Tanacetum coccineum TaxID=301880 RepID=A0ABQ5CKN7_9ASTR
MDDPNITMEEYIKLEEEKARRRGKVYNWETATYGKIWYDEDVHDLRSVETEFPAIVFNGALTSKVALSCEPTVSPLNNNQIDFRISFDESDDEDYTNEFPAITYNDALTSKLDFSEPTVSPQHIDEFHETSLSECDGEEQNVIYFNDPPLTVIYPDDLTSNKDNDDDKIDIKQFLEDNVINTDVGAYAKGSNKLLETSIDTAYPGEPSEDDVDIVYNDALKFEYDFSSEPALNSKLTNDINLENETSSPKYLFSYETPSANNLQLDKGNDDDKIGVKQFLRDIFVDTYVDENGKTIHDTINMALPPRNDRHAWLRILRECWVGSMIDSYAWRALLGIRGPLVREVILEFYSTLRKPLRRLCHRLITFIIVGKGQAPEKVTTTDLSLYYTTRCALWGDYGAEPLNFDSGGHELTTIDIEELVDPDAPQEDVFAGQEGVQADPAP